MNKPDAKTILHIIELKERATDLYNEVDRRVAELMQYYGEGRFDYDLDEIAADEDLSQVLVERCAVLMENGRYLKFEITDNVRALQNGIDVWRWVSFKPVGYSVGSLKRCPDSLK